MLKARRLGGRLMAAAFWGAAKRLGARVVQGAAGLIGEAGRVRGVVEGERIEAVRVVVTAVV